MVGHDVAPIVRAIALGRTYHVGVSQVGLWDATLEIRPGEFLAVLGPSGSGKSTLMNLLGLLDTPSSGTLQLFGVDVAEMSAQQRAGYRSGRIGFVFQSFYLLPKRTVNDNIATGLLFCCRRKDRQDRVQEVVDRVGLKGRGEQSVETLSGGERQRVAVARALAKSPVLLLADEPTGNLDRPNGEAVFKLLRRSAEDGAAVVVVTHNFELAAAADRMIEVLDGYVR